MVLIGGTKEKNEYDSETISGTIGTPTFVGQPFIN